jgi:uncharacterized protein YigE (DUF2233 family)
MAAIRSSLLLFLAALISCDQPAEERGAGTAEKPKAGACETRSFEGSTFTACRYDPASHGLELILDGETGPLRSFAALERHLGPRANHLLFAMNAGMYDEEGDPIGLYVEKGKSRHRINLRPGPGDFHLKPNGVFAVDDAGRVAIVPSERFAAKVKNARWATQSGPMLVIAGKLHPKFDPDGPSRLLRNGVGVAGPRDAWFAISEEGVSFGRFARFFRDALGCRDALYLDGTVSSLWDPASGRQDSHAELGPMVAVFRKPPKSPTPKAP